MREMNIDTVSNEEIQDLFEKVFEPVANMNDVDEFDIKCSREVNKDFLIVEVTIVGMAGSPTIDNFKEDKIEELRRVTISRDDKGSLTFELQPEETTFLNPNDYIIVYKSV